MPCFVDIHCPFLNRNGGGDARGEPPTPTSLPHLAPTPSLLPPYCKGEVAGRGGRRGNCSLDRKINFSKDTKISKTWLDPSEDPEWDEAYVLVFVEFEYFSIYSDMHLKQTV